jgi:hypothetical protein
MDMDRAMKNLETKQIHLSVGWEIFVVGHSKYSDMEGFGKMVVKNVNEMVDMGEKMGKPLTPLILVVTLGGMLTKMIEQQYDHETIQKAVLLCPFLLGHMLRDDPPTKNEAVYFFLNSFVRKFGINLQEGYLDPNIY